MIKSGPLVYIGHLGSSNAVRKSKWCLYIWQNWNNLFCSGRPKFPVVVMLIELKLWTWFENQYKSFSNTWIDLLNWWWIDLWIDLLKKSTKFEYIWIDLKLQPWYWFELICKNGELSQLWLVFMSQKGVKRRSQYLYTWLLLSDLLTLMLEPLHVLNQA